MRTTDTLQWISLTALWVMVAIHVWNAEPTGDVDELAARHASLVAKIESLERQKTELEVAVRAREARLR